MKEFNKLYKEYYPRIFAFLYKMCSNHFLTEELAQETFLQAYKSLHKFHGDCELFTWLVAIAKHVYYQYLRKNRLRFEATSLDYMVEAYYADTLANPEDTYQKKAVAQAVRRMILQIPEKYKNVVILRIYGDMPFAQVAKALGISESSAKVIFFRAKKMMMEELKHELEL